MSNYNFVIFGSADDYYMASYREVNKASNVRYICKKIDTDNKILNVLFSLHCSQTSQKRFNLPFKKIWNSQYCKQRFDNEKPICFVFFRKHLWRLNHGYAEYLRKKYPRCKLVAFYQDLVAQEKSISIEDVKNKLDLVLSFDQKDASDYGLIYYPLVYTPEELETEGELPKSDVFFVGKAKNRLSEILTAYEKLSEAGLVCDFHIVGVPEADRKYADKINYCSQMSYVENIKHIKATSCLLEIMQQGGHGYTLRACEAIAYGKRMITNNPEIKGAPFYRPELISVFENPEDIDAEFVKNGEFSVDYNYKEELSPLKMLEFVESKIQ